MCQQFEAESRHVARDEADEIEDLYARHMSGVATLTDSEITDLIVRMLRLRER